MKKNTWKKGILFAGILGMMTACTACGGVTVDETGLYINGKLIATLTPSAEHSNTPMPTDLQAGVTSSVTLTPEGNLTPSAGVTSAPTPTLTPTMTPIPTPTPTQIFTPTPEPTALPTVSDIFGTVNSALLNMRERWGASDDNRLVVTLVKEEKVMVFSYHYAADGGLWARVACERDGVHYYGYVNSKYLTILDPYGEIPMPTPTLLPTHTPTPFMIDHTDERVPVTAKGFYARGADLRKQDSVNKMCELLEDTELNTIVVDVKDDEGKLIYTIEDEYVKELYGSTYTVTSIDSFIEGMKSRGVYTIARIVAFADTLAAEAHPELAMRYEDGTLYYDLSKKAWLNPYNSDAQEYVLRIAEQAAKDGFQEINFDYVRFSTDAGSEKVDYGPLAQTYTRTDIITAFAKEACIRLRPLGVYVSVDVFGITINSSVDEERVGQNYAELAKVVDYICPMIYPSHYANNFGGLEVPDAKPYELIRFVLQTSKTRLSEISGVNCAVVRPWLQAFTASWVPGYIIYNGEVIRKQIDAVYDAGYEEWLLWNSSMNYSKDGLLEE